MNWRTRLEAQIHSACQWLEELSPAPWIYGEELTRADLAVAVAMQYLERVVPEHDSARVYPKLQAHRERCKALEAFSRVQDSTEEALASGWRPETAP